MDIRRLVRMANDIGAFFEAYPDRDQAVAGIAHHLRTRWAPVMRRQIIDYLDADGAGLNQIVRDAVAALARESAPHREADTGGEKPTR
ncbi:MAG: formate dehydrogenase subunit delta [Candidatus Binataceae bacterium]